MKTNKMGSPNFWLTFSGWTLAVFVSLLYLHEKSTPGRVNHIPVNPTAASTPDQSERVKALLFEARVLLGREQPDEAINRITTLWSVCHATHQEVPEESHRLFARAVSQMSQNNTVEPPSRRPKPEKTRFTVQEAPPEIRRPASVKTAPPKRPDKKRGQPKLTIPTPDYPLAKNESGKQVKKPKPPRFPALEWDDDEEEPPFRPRTRERFPGPPHSRTGQVRRPKGPPRHPRPRQHTKKPLEAGSGGPPPGYLHELLDD